MDSPAGCDVVEEHKPTRLLPATVFHGALLAPSEERRRVRHFHNLCELARSWCGAAELGCPQDGE